MRPGDGLRASRGFTYLALLWWVAISGVMLAALGSQWRLDGTRQRETELVFRGEQIRAALAAYQANSPAGQPNLPTELGDLLDDTRQGSSRRHLRRLWNDPITRQPWGLLRTEDGRIRGVYSVSTRKPLTASESVSTYREWLFDVPEVAPQPADAASSPYGVPGAPGTPGGGGSLFNPVFGAGSGAGSGTGR